MTDDEAEFGRYPLPPELSPRSGRRPGKLSAGRRARRPHRLLTIVAGALSFLVLATSAFAYGYYEKLNGNIHRVDAFGYASEKDRPAKAKDGAQNILLVGDDSRVGLSPAELAEIGTDQDGGAELTDTIMLMHISSDNVVTIVGFPRDSYVPIPGRGMDKINSAYADGENEKKGNGPAKLTQTVENLTGVRIDHYIQVGFTQFIAISNVIGGVTVCIKTKDGKGSNDPDYTGLTLSDGYHTIKGAEALAYVRQRHGLPQGDIDRIGRQQRFITAMVKKIKDTRDPSTINTLLQQVSSSLTVDSGLSGRGLIDFATRLQSIDLSAIRFETVPVANADAWTSDHKVNYVQLDMARLPAVFAPLANDTGTGSPTATPSPTAPAVAPSSVSVQILNGRGTNGAATTASTDLKQFGFIVASTGNATRTDTTTIRYGTSQALAGAALAEAIPGVKLVPDPSLGATVVLTLGTDNLAISDPGHPPAAATVTPSVTAADNDCGV